MSAAGLFDALNATVAATFGPQCVYYPDSTNLPTPPNQPLAFFNLLGTPVDPIRSEGIPNSNVAIRWVNSDDFALYGYTPLKGDLLVTETGAIYVVEQVQADSGGGVNLIMLMKEV